MIVVGVALLILSFSDILNPRAHCPYYGSGVGVYGPAGCNTTPDPALQIMTPSSTNFILIVLAACLAAFGAAIAGIVLRLS
jgi:hypothetical protein